MSEMSLVDPFGEFNTLFVDSTVDDATRLAMEYQEIIDAVGAEDCTERELNEIVTDLDKHWGYMHEYLKVSGTVFMAVPENPDEPHVQILTDVAWDGMTVESLGFYAIPQREELNNDTERGTYKLGHLFRLPPEVVSQDPLLDSVIVKRAFALPDKVMIEHEQPTEQQLFNNVHYHFPEVAQDIDIAILNATDVTDAVRRLASLRIPGEATYDWHDLRMMMAYINSRLEFDSAVPTYCMQFEGYCYTVGAKGNLMPSEADSGETLAIPHGIEFVPDYELHKAMGKIDLIPGLRITLANKSIALDNGVQYVIPITDSFTMQDGRSRLYNIIDGKEDS